MDARIDEKEHAKQAGGLGHDASHRGVVPTDRVHLSPIDHAAAGLDAVEASSRAGSHLAPTMTTLGARRVDAR